MIPLKDRKESLVCLIHGHEECPCPDDKSIACGISTFDNDIDRMYIHCYNCGKHSFGLTAQAQRWAWE